MSSTGSPDRAEKVRGGLVTPGLASSSARTTDSASRTAPLIFFRITAGSSSRSMMPCGEEDDFDILLVGSCRSVILDTAGRMYGAGTGNVSPERWLNRCAGFRDSPGG